MKKQYFEVEKTPRLVCVWVRVGRAEMPLRCVWLDAAIASANVEAATAVELPRCA